MAIGHFAGTRDSGRFVLDVVRGAQPPFDPQAVTKQYAALLREYGLHEVTGDNYAATWVETAFKDAGIKYVRSEKTEICAVSRSPDAVCAWRHFAAGPQGVAARVAVAGASRSSFRPGHGRSWRAGTTIMPMRCWPVPR